VVKLELTAKTLEETLRSNELNMPILIEFWGSWCPPCQKMKDVISTLEKKYNGQIKIAKINIDKNPGIATKYDIKGVPTYIVFQNGKIIHRDVGAKSERQLEAMIKKVI